MTVAAGGSLETFRTFWRVAVQPHRREAAVLLGMMLLGAAMDTLSVALTVPLLDLLMGQRAPGASGVTARVLQRAGIDASAPSVVAALLLGVGALFILRGAVVLWTQYRTVAVAVTLRRTTRVAMLERLLRARYDELTRRTRGAMVADITLPAEALCGGMIDLGRFVMSAMTVLSMTALLLGLSWWGTLLVATVGTGTMAGWRVFADRRAAEQGRVMFALQERQSALHVELLDGAKVVKAHGLETPLVAQYDAAMRQELVPELRFMLLRDGPTLVHEVLAVALVVMLGAAMVFIPSSGLSVPVLAGFLIGIRRIAPAVSGMAATSANLHRDRTKLQVVEELLSRLPQERQGGTAVGPVREVRLDRVDFTYPSRPQRQVLENISLTLRPGTVTAVVGATGSGKSTIASVLMGFYDPAGGAILINGVPLDRLDLTDWRRRAGCVSQDVFVFHASVRENITLWDPTVTEAQVREAARAAQLEPVLAMLREGFDTVVGDRGVRLSGGQCQRLAIARVLARCPELLILDEATSALDNVTERAVYGALRATAREAAVLVIAHRLSTIRDADQIVVLDGGRVAEQGTHEELLARASLYAKLYTEEPSVREPAATEPVAVTSSA